MSQSGSVYLHMYLATMHDTTLRMDYSRAILYIIMPASQNIIRSPSSRHADPQCNTTHSSLYQFGWFNSDQILIGRIQHDLKISVMFWERSRSSFPSTVTVVFCHPPLLTGQGRQGVFLGPTGRLRELRGQVEFLGERGRKGGIIIYPVDTRWNGRYC